MRSTISNMLIERALVSHCVIVRHFIRILTIIDPTHETSTISYQRLLYMNAVPLWLRRGSEEDPLLARSIEYGTLEV